MFLTCPSPEKRFFLFITLFYITGLVLYLESSMVVSSCKKRNFELSEIKELVKGYKPDIKEASLEFYLVGLKRLKTVSDKKDIKSVQTKSSEKIKLSDIINVDKNIDLLEKNIKSVSSRKNIVSSVLVFLGSIKENYKCVPKVLSKYQEYHKTLAKKKEDSYMDNEMNVREKENWLTGEDIRIKIKELKDYIDKYQESSSYPRLYVDIYQKYLVLNLYTLLPPLRNDYANVKIIKDCKDFGEKEDCVDTAFNYINMCSKKLLLCTYKTKKFYGIKKIDIPDNLFEIIECWENIKTNFLDSKECFSDKNEDFLLINTTNCEKMKTNSLTKYINRIFSPKKVSTTMLRKIYLSEKYPVIVSYRDQVRDAMVMGHSLSMQKMVYSKKIEK